MSLVQSNYSRCNQYYIILNTSQTSFDKDFSYQQKDILNNSEDSIINTFSSLEVNEYDILKFTNLINDKAFKFYFENKEYFQDKMKNDEIINKISSSIDKSINNYENVIRFCSNLNFIIKFKPEIEFDDDGELSFEWYGRKGARANLTFGKNGELYFVSLFHGEILKLKLFNNDYSLKIINDELFRIYEDKVS